MDKGELKMKWAYQTMVCGVVEGFQMPGVEYAFQDGICLEMLHVMGAASNRLCERLGVTDEDQDIATIIYALEQIQEELCYRMYRCGAQFGL